MYYDAKFEDDALVMELRITDRFNDGAAKKIPLADIASQVGYIHDDKFKERLSLAMKRDDVEAEDKGVRRMLYGLDLDDIKAKVPALVELPAIQAWIPFTVMYHDGKPDEAGADAYTEKIFNEVAAGKESANGYTVRALVSPAAVDSITDHGNYRDIVLKPGFGTDSIVTALPAADLKKRLGM